MNDTPPCRWLQDSDGLWNASCGENRYFELNDGTPRDNHMRYCCYCGGRLRFTSYREGS